MPKSSTLTHPTTSDSTDNSVKDPSWNTSPHTLAEFLRDLMNPDSLGYVRYKRLGCVREQHVFVNSSCSFVYENFGHEQVFANRPCS